MSDSESPPHVLSSTDVPNHSEKITHRPSKRNQHKSHKLEQHSHYDTSPHINKSQSFNYSDSESDFSIGTENEIGIDFTDIKFAKSTTDRSRIYQLRSNYMETSTNSKSTTAKTTEERRTTEIKSDDNKYSHKNRLDRKRNNMVPQYQRN
jgi:hypothetical protein